MLNSFYQELGIVRLPVWRGRNLYMTTVDTGAVKMPEGFQDYEPVVADLCERANHSGTVHVTVDEKIVQPGMSQRRPGAHVDGCYVRNGQYWGHGPGPGWLHGCNVIPGRMAVIVAATVVGCMAYPGEFDAQPKDDGDLEHIREQLGRGELLSAHHAYLLSPDCVHESMKFFNSTKRTFLRIALES